MPINEIPTLDFNQISRILLMTASGKLTNKVNNNNNELIEEVNLDFARTMNKLIFDKHLRTNDKDLINDELEINMDLEIKKVPYNGMIKTPDHDFPEQFSKFCYYSLYLKEEVISSLSQIKEECDKITNDMNIFNTSINNTMNLDGFRQIQ